ncbi:hypothetical protein G9A89_003549 [Geosiphon pyriformis]|nr:hypothetical protein G9A89_003549 [Geosiphon pyriformis]
MSFLRSQSNSATPIQTTTSFLRRSGNARNNTLTEEDVSERDAEGERQPKPQFNSECFRRMELMIEFTNLRNPRHCPSGVYVMPAADNFHKLYFQPIISFLNPKYVSFITYPEKRPTVSFIDSDLFHPLIDPNTGAFSLAQEFRDWAPHKYYIFHILHYIKKSFKKMVLDNLVEKHCLNKKAFSTYRDEIYTFDKMAKQCANLSISGTKLYENHIESNDASSKNDSNPIRFTKLEGEDFQLLEELKKTYLVTPVSPEKDKERLTLPSRRSYSTNSIL